MIDIPLVSALASGVTTRLVSELASQANIQLTSALASGVTTRLVSELASQANIQLTSALASQVNVRLMSALASSVTARLGSALASQANVRLMSELASSVTTRLGSEVEVALDALGSLPSIREPLLTSDMATIHAAVKRASDFVAIVASGQSHPALSPASTEARHHTLPSAPILPQSQFDLRAWWQAQPHIHSKVSILAVYVAIHILLEVFNYSLGSWMEYTKEQDAAIEQTATTIQLQAIEREIVQLRTDMQRLDSYASSNEFGVVHGFVQYVTLKDAPLRADPWARADRLATIPAATVLTVHAHQGRWRYVSYVNVQSAVTEQGWVYTTHMRRVEPVHQ